MKNKHPNHYYQGLLFQAIQENDIQKIAYLVNRADININEKDSNNNTALHFLYGFTDNIDTVNRISKILIKAGIDTQAKNNQGNTAEMLKEFIYHGRLYNAYQD